MAYSRARFSDEFVPGLFGLAIDTYRMKRAESMWSQMCTKKTSKKESEENLDRSGVGMPELKADGAKVAYDVQIPGTKQEWIHDVWALAIRIHEEAIEDNLYELGAGGSGDKLKEPVHDLSEAMAENEEVKMARFLVNGAATTYHTTRSSKALFATDHPRLDGSTFSNKSTATDMTYTAFWSAVVAAENQLGHTGYRVSKKVKNVWVPPQMERQAIEILKSSDRPDTGNRATNAMVKSGRKIGIKVWPHLTDADAWYLQLDGTGIIHFTRRKQRFARERDFQTGDMMIKADQRWSAEVDDPRDWYGVIPA